MNTENQQIYNRESSKPQKMMVFFLAMTIFGLSDLITNLVPVIKFGPFKIGISYFSFVSLILCMLLNPFYAALGSCVGKIVFGDILMGGFNGIGKFERFFEYFLGMYVAGLIVKNPKSKVNLIIASLVGVGIDRFLSGIVDIAKIYVGLSNVKPIPGFCNSAVLLEILSNVIELFINGVLLGVIPVLYLVPKLNGKIEPLMGMEPRKKSSSFKSLKEVMTLRRILTGIALMFLAIITQFISKMDNFFNNIIHWNKEFVNQYIGALHIIGICLVLMVLTVVVIIISTISKKINKRRIGYE